MYRLQEPLSAADLTSKIELPARIAGSADRLIYGASSLEEAGAGALCFCSAERHAVREAVLASSADTIVIRDNLPDMDRELPHKTLILVEDPMLYFVRCLNLLFPHSREKIVQQGAFVHSGAHLEEGVLIEALAMVDNDVSIATNSEIHCGVRIYPGTRIGKRVRIQSNTVVGATGLAYGTESDGSYTLMRHLGGVIIGDDVDIGANTTIVRGILRDTVIGSGSKIGNLVNVGHNVIIGRNCFISAGAVICGSVEVGDNVWIAPGAKILNRIKLGRGAQIGLGAVVISDVQEMSVVAGVPAKHLYHKDSKK